MITIPASKLRTGDVLITRASGDIRVTDVGARRADCYLVTGIDTHTKAKRWRYIDADGTVRVRRP